MPLKLVAPSSRSPYWQIRGTLYGRTIFASTKARDKASARRFKNEFEIKLAQSADQKRGAATFGEAARLYIEFRRPRKADETWINRLCEMIGEKLLTDIRQHVLVDAAIAMYPKGAPETRNRQVITPASSVLHYAADNDLCPYIRVKKFKEKRPEPRAMRREEAAVLIAAAQGSMKHVLLFLFMQGWRISDVLRVRWEHIDFDAATIRHHVSKTDEWLIMPLHIRVLDALRSVRKDFGPTFAWTDKNNFYRSLRPLCAATGVHFTPHMARHSFATWLAADNVSMKEIMEAGAWRDHKSVMRYTKVDERRVRLTVNKIKI